jgi:hypothetical protein
MAPNIEERLTRLETMENFRTEDIKEIKADLKALPATIEKTVSEGLAKCREIQDLKSRSEQQSEGFNFKKLGAIFAGLAATGYGAFEVLMYIGKAKNWF